MKGGQALTPFIAFVLFEADGNDKKRRKERALEFIRAGINEEGALGFSDPMIVEYPNYATSYALRLMARSDRSADERLLHRMYDYLLAQQFDESRSITSDHIAYGGWGFGEQGLPAGQVGYVDLSHTRRVLQALVSTRLPLPDSLVIKSRQFLGAVQNRPLLETENANYYDGGFHYSPVVLLANKGNVIKQSESSIFLSYATATCDGLLALAATGADQNSEAVQDALEWLNGHPVLSFPEGIPEDDPDQWHRVMFYYHLAVRAEVYNLFGWPAEAKNEMVQMLEERIREDGSFVNPLGAANKENDPLLATALALSALHYIKK